MNIFLSEQIKCHGSLRGYLPGKAAVRTVAVYVWCSASRLVAATRVLISACGWKEDDRNGYCVGS